MNVGATGGPFSGWSPPISNQRDPNLNQVKSDKEKQAAMDALKALEQPSARGRSADAVSGGGGGCSGSSGSSGTATNPDQDAIDEMVRMGYSPAAAAKAIKDAKMGAGCAEGMGCPSCGGGACTCASMNRMQ